MLRVCLGILKNLPQYAYKLYAYKKKNMYFDPFNKYKKYIYIFLLFIVYILPIVVGWQVQKRNLKIIHPGCLIKKWSVLPKILQFQTCTFLNQRLNFGLMGFFN